MVENICKWYDQQRINLQNLQTALVAKYPKNNPIKNGLKIYRVFSREDIQMVNKYMKRCSTLLIIKEIQIKTTVRYHCTPVKTAIIKKSTNNKCWRGWREKGTLPYCWWECKLVQPLWKTVWRFLKKLKIELPHDSASPSLGIYPEKIMVQKDTCTSMITAELFTMAKIRYGSNRHRQMNG